MKKLAIAATAILLISAADPGFARGFGYGHGFRHGGFGHHGFGGYRYSGGRHNPGAYLVGGLLLGTLLAPPRYAPPPRVVYLPPPSPAPVHVITAPAPAPVAQASISRRLLRDINGNCFERKIDTRGSELRIELPASECAW